MKAVALGLIAVATVLIYIRLYIIGGQLNEIINLLSK